MDPCFRPRISAPHSAHSTATSIARFPTCQSAFGVGAVLSASERTLQRRCAPRSAAAAPASMANFVRQPPSYPRFSSASSALRTVPSYGSMPCRGALGQRKDRGPHRSAVVVVIGRHSKHRTVLARIWMTSSEERRRRTRGGGRRTCAGPPTLWETAQADAGPIGRWPRTEGGRGLGSGLV